MKRVHVVEEKNMMKCKACGKLLKQSQYEKIINISLAQGVLL